MVIEPRSEQALSIDDQSNKYGHFERGENEGIQEGAGPLLEAGPFFKGV